MLTSGLAACGTAGLFGFTVDDAWISARVAAHLAAGLGHRFNAHGPETDAVTPLGWEYLLALFARPGVEAAWIAARVLGVLAWLGAAGYLGVLIAESGTRARRFAVLALLPFAAPLGAYASAGMETGVVVALCTLALGPQLPWLLCAGVAAAWRPELMPWAITWGLGRALVADRHEPSSGPRRLRRLLLTAALVLTPALVLALLRRSWFGAGPPLAFLAKPPSLELGMRYALGAFVFSGVPLALLAPPRVLAALDGHGRVLLAASLVHFVAIAVAGGDWMAFYRLAAPALPGILLVAAKLADRSRWPTLSVRLAAALAGALLLSWTHGPAARAIVKNRSELISRARPVLVGAENIAALDIGWLGAASDATIIDLAGVTDPRVARLPGSHTSKRLPASFLENRQIDTLVLLLAANARPDDLWEDHNFQYAVEARLARAAQLAGFSLCARLPLRGLAQEYVVLKKAPYDRTLCSSS